MSKRSRSLEDLRTSLTELKLIYYFYRKSVSAMAGLVILVTLIFVAILAPWLSPYDPLEVDLPSRLMAPSFQHFFGTDSAGRDIFSRVLYGTRISLVAAIGIVLLGGSIGTLFGLASGYVGGRFDLLVMRVTDIFLAFPTFLLAILLAATLGPGMTTLLISVSVPLWPEYARLVRGSTLSEKNKEFIEAAVASGENSVSILFRQILPNVLSPLLVKGTIDVGFSILWAAGLSFLGLGIQPPTPEWGNMVSAGRSYMATKIWVAGFPGLAILLATLAFNLAGDGFRDALDPKLRV
jgi:peptide/nickel transport system permease protein